MAAFMRTPPSEREPWSLPARALRGHGLADVLRVLPSSLSPIGDQVTVPPKIALQVVHGPLHRREIRIARREVPHAPLQPPEPLEAANALRDCTPTQPEAECRYVRSYHGHHLPLS